MGNQRVNQRVNQRTNLPQRQQPPLIKKEKRKRVKGATGENKGKVQNEKIVRKQRRQGRVKGDPPRRQTRQRPSREDWVAKNRMRCQEQPGLRHRLCMCNSRCELSILSNLVTWRHADLLSPLCQRGALHALHDLLATYRATILRLCPTYLFFVRFEAIRS